ncbi:MAG: N-acetyl-gamma-glutamyl-phosphate reductase [Gloeomargarita sp. SKYBB_i_bin120]|nr:N-acetyl-gamma-glutamyl-phosphate reductase [Gloeomargarita sp. SKYB120]MDW8178164.1 N-acetyl-gamma-glutamyl-phosphate reductase [Gloeomargarita sp. SKYBB_i_bin120]
MTETTKVPVAVVGASGYGGLQLVRLLLEHPHLELVYLGGDTSAGQEYADIYPHLGHRLHRVVEPVDVSVIARKAQVVFLSLPNGVAPKLVPDLLAAGCQVLDLSADYRFRDLQTYQTWYGIERSDKEVAAKAVYGLPELYRDALVDARLVGCPGCYPTASLLALAPLLRQGLVVWDSIVIDAKSGTSGGGRQAKTHLLLAEADQSVAAYGVARHRHRPEIEQVCADLAGQPVKVQFTPHLVPMVRGILATVYAQMRDPGLTTEDLLMIYQAFYRGKPWVRVLPPGVYPQTKWACGTNMCYIGLELDTHTDRVVVMSAIDNLIKGQAGQAVQCLNISRGWPETLGLPQLSFYP